MSTTTSTLLSAQALSMQADGVTVLDNINLELQRGELLGVIGPNGAGKSTLLKVLAGIEPAASGSVSVQGTPMHELSPAQRARRIAWLEQRPQLHWPLTVRQVVALGRLPYRGNSAEVVDAAAIDKALAITGIEGLQQRLFPRLSEGEKLLVNLARILATECDVMLADEPVSALDPRHQLQVMVLLQQLAFKGAGVVVVLHDLTLAARYCQRLLLLHAGKVVACGTPAALLTAENLALVYGIDANLDTNNSTVLIKGPLP